MRAEERRLGNSSPAPTQPTTAETAASGRSLTVRFTEQKLNAMIAKWELVYHWERQYGQYFSEPYPARATVQVARLPKDARVEIDVIASYDEGR